MQSGHYIFGVTLGSGNMLCFLTAISTHLENTAADGNVAGEGALLVYVGSLLRQLGGLKPKTNVLHEPHALVLRAFEIGAIVERRGDEQFREQRSTCFESGEDGGILTSLHSCVRLLLHSCGFRR